MSCSNPHRWYKKSAEKNSKLSDVQFEDTLKKGDLPPSLFDHGVSVGTKDPLLD